MDYLDRYPAELSPLRNWPGESPKRLILFARLSRFFSAALRLNGNQTAVKATGSGSSAKGRKTIPVVGSSAVAAPTMVTPKPCPTMDSSAPRPTSKRRIDGAGQSPAWRSTIWL